MGYYIGLFIATVVWYFLARLYVWAYEKFVITPAKSLWAKAKAWKNKPIKPEDAPYDFV